MALRLLVDAERLVRDYLAAQADLSALVQGRVYVGVIPPQPTWPLVRLWRVGGAPRWPQWLDPARIQIEAWADLAQYEQARTVARTAQAALQLLKGHQTLGTVTGVDQVTGLQNLPDPDSARPRVMFDAVVYIHP